jgi:hypothetical protein
VTAIAPTGTISFLMDCDTTTSNRAGAPAGRVADRGGVLRRAALPADGPRGAGLRRGDAAGVLAHVDATGGVDGAPGLAAGPPRCSAPRCPRRRARAAGARTSP